MKQKFHSSDNIFLIIFLLATILVLVVRFVLSDMLDLVFILTLAIYGCAFLVTYALSRGFTKRLKSLTMHVEGMAAGNLTKRIKFLTRDELGQLSNALNELTYRLETGVAIDVTKHKEINQAKTDFVTLASHQLRTPLSIIKWYVDFLLLGDAGEINNEQKRYLKEVYRSNERLIELVNALLDVSRIDLGKFSIEPEPTNIILTADMAIHRFMPEIDEKRIKIEKNYEDIPAINLDPRLIKMVFENLISNSVKYTPEKGKIKISITKTEEDVFIKIADTGFGIPREEQPKIFTKLFRADNIKKIESVGTGLGLYIVKAIIEKSGGKIWFESPSLELLLDAQKDGNIADHKYKGTTFFITIPLKGMKPKAGTKKLSSYV